MHNKDEEPSGVASGNRDESRPSDQLVPGTKLRHYIIHEVVGRGGFGITYRATHETLSSRQYAIKEYFPTSMACRNDCNVVPLEGKFEKFAHFRDRCLLEAELLSLCQHPAIVEVIDYFEANNTAYTVLNYISGQTFSSWCDGLGHRPDAEEIDRILVPLLSALEVVHKNKLLHRDIAPDNIIVRPDGTPCLIDFGAARMHDRARTEQTHLVVKRGYSPPEQYQDEFGVMGPWTDIYALGATLYRALCGRPPNDASRRLLDPRLPELFDAVNSARHAKEFLRAVEHALHPEPKLRPQSIGEWQDEMRAAQIEDSPVIMVAAATPTTGAIEGTQTVIVERPGATSSQNGAVTRPPAADGPQSAPSAPRDLVPEMPGRAPQSKMLLFGGAILLVGAIAPLIPFGIATKTQDSMSKPGVELPRPQTAPPANPKSGNDPLQSETNANSKRPQPLDNGPPPKRLNFDDSDSPSDTSPVNNDASTPSPQDSEQLLRLQSQCRGQNLPLVIDACKALTSSPNLSEAERADAYFHLGVAFRKTKKLSEADDALTAALGLSRDAGYYNQRGVIHSMQSAHQAALDDFNEAVRLELGNGEYQNNLAWALLKLGRVAEAVQHADKAVEALATKSYVWDTRGQINEALGRKTNAINDYRMALALDPRSADSAKGLQRLSGQ